MITIKKAIQQFYDLQSCNQTKVLSLFYEKKIKKEKERKGKGRDQKKDPITTSSSHFLLSLLGFLLFPIFFQSNHSNKI